ncbi:hypothetical protein JCM8097_000083 [Rhodosporidiobolus ruineniae]
MSGAHAGPSALAAETAFISTGKRSRLGCLTCRSRKKKCDEGRKPEHGGACERCFLASYKCEWPEPPGKRPIKSFAPGSRGGPRPVELTRTASTASARGMDGSAGHAQAGVVIGAGPSASTSLPAASAPYAYPQQQPPPIFPGPSPSPFSFLPHPHQLSASSYGGHAPALPPPPPPPSAFLLAPSSFAAAYSSFAAPSSSSSTTTFPPSSQELALSASLPPSSTFDLQHTLDSLIAPYAAVLNSATAGQTGYDLDQFLASMDPVLASTTTSVNLSIDNRASPRRREQVLASVERAESRTSSSGDGVEKGKMVETDGVEELDPLYGELTQEFMTGLPKAVVNITVTLFNRVAASNAVGRNAAKAMSLLYRRHQLQQEQSPASSPASVSSPPTEEETRLLATARSHYEKALEMFHSSSLPLEAKLLAGFDLASYEHDQYGIGPTEKIFNAIEEAVQEQLGPRPLLKLHPLNEPLDLLLVMLANLDVTACMYEKKRRTLFRYPGLPGQPLPPYSTAAPPGPSVTSPPWTPPRCDIQLHFGLPTAIFLCIAAINQLEVDRDTTSAEEVYRRANEIERAIREWPGLGTADPQERADAALWLEMVGTAEMWRYAAIIYLNQAVYSRGPVSKAISDATQQILSTGALLLHPRAPVISLIQNSSSSSSALTRPSSASSTPSSSFSPRTAPSPSSKYCPTGAWRCGPWFMAGTCTMLPADRDLVRQGLRASGDQAGIRDCLKGLERIWQVQDEEGYPVKDWREFLEKEGLKVGF